MRPFFIMPLRNLLLIACTGGVLLVMSGCHTLAKPPKDDDGLSWAAEPAPPPSNGSIYQAGREVALFENPIAHRVGDIVTVVLNEQTAAQKSATTTTTKNTTDALGATIIGKTPTIKGNA